MDAGARAIHFDHAGNRRGRSPVPWTAAATSLTGRHRQRVHSTDKRRVTSTRRFRVYLPDTPEQFVTILLILLGATLRVWQYLANSSLWIDEAALARNILERPAEALFQPLDYAQAAPVGFLLIEEAVTWVAGTSELALRAFPLACGLGALLLFWAVSRRILSGWAVPFAVGLFSLGIPFIYFSSQVKQYSSDVAAALLVLLAAIEIRRQGVTYRRALISGIAGAAIVWVSQSALFVLAGVGAGLLILAVLERDRTSAQRLSITWALWASSAAAAAAFSLQAVSDMDREYFRWFWADGFMPLPPERLVDLAWVPRKLTWVFGAFAPGLGHTNGGLNYRWSPVFVAVMLYGYSTLWRKQRDTALFLLLPVAIAVALSAAAIYPFTARLMAFLVPSLLLATAAGGSHLVSSLPARLQFLSPVVLAVLGGAPIYAAAAALPPSRVQHIRPVLEHVGEAYRAGDRIYVYYGAGVAFGYYAPRFRLPRDGVVLGRCALGEPRRYLRELDRLRGHTRVWVVLTHEGHEGEVALVRGYLNEIGRQVDAISVPASSGRPIEHAYGYLYDLSDRDRPDSATAESYELPASLGRVPDSVRRWGCYGITGGEPLNKGP